MPLYKSAFLLLTLVTIASPIQANQFNKFSLRHISSGSEPLAPISATEEKCKAFDNQVQAFSRKIWGAYRACFKTMGNQMDAAYNRGMKYGHNFASANMNGFTRTATHGLWKQCEELHSPPIVDELKQQARACFNAAQAHTKAMNDMRRNLVSENDAGFMGLLTGQMLGIQKNCSNTKSLGKQQACASSISSLTSTMRGRSVSNPHIRNLQNHFSNRLDALNKKTLADLDAAKRGFDKISANKGVKKTTSSYVAPTKVAVVEIKNGGNSNKTAEEANLGTTIKLNENVIRSYKKNAPDTIQYLSTRGWDISSARCRAEAIRTTLKDPTDFFNFMKRDKRVGFRVSDYNSQDDTDQLGWLMRNSLNGFAITVKGCK